MEPRIVRFFSEGSRLEGDYVLPADFRKGEQRAGIVLCHGYTGIRQAILPEYARRFAAAGYVVLAFDYRGFGGSEGEKWRLLPLEQVEDIRNAVTWLSIQDEVDPERIGLWGTSYGGAHAPYVAAIDTRVKAAVGQVGFGDGERFILDTRSHAERRELFRRLDQDRRLRVLENRTDRADAATILASPQTRAFLGEAVKAMPELHAEISWESAEKTLDYRPIEIVHKIAPRALCLIGAEKDDLCRFDGYRKLYERAGEPRQLVGLPITHYEIYGGEWLERSAKIAIEWFDRFLK